MRLKIKKTGSFKSSKKYLDLIANSKVYDVATNTPISYAANISTKLGNDVFLKREDMQPIFSFKIRGAYNKIANLTPQQKKRGVLTASAGNHAQGVARAVTTRGLKATIIMPEDTPATKIEGTKAYGADVVTYDRYTESREEIGEALSQKYNANLIKPYDDVRVIAGQGTVGLEIARQVSVMGVVPNALICCCGGGGSGRGLWSLCGDGKSK